HIFDPRIGRPIETEVASASVLAKTVRDADAYAKAFMILKKSEAKALSERLKMPAFLMMHKGAGFESTYYSDFEAYFVRI
ncbi:MAG: FAD:protein FMN transferase ApbE, partial [Proteobacteria bacterium]